MDSLFIGSNKISLSSVDSTNNYAANLIKMTLVPDGTVIMALNQTNGRGQRQNSWKSEPGQNLLCTYILKPHLLKVELAFTLGAMAALAVAESISKHCPKKSVHIKWPNDIMLNNKKVAGILIENTIVKKEISVSLIGIGININQIEFNLDQATSIRKETQKIMDLDECLIGLNKFLEKWYLKLREGNTSSIIDKYNNYLWKKNSEVFGLLHDKKVKANIIDIMPNGKIRLSINGEISSAEYGEFKLIYE